VPKIINNGTGNVVIAAGSNLDAGDGTGGQVKTVEGNIDYVFSPYDPLSSTVMALMSHDLIMTVTVPKEKILQQYDDSWLAFYPSIGDVRKKMMDKRSKETDEEFLDLDAIQEMFKSILSDSVPINKKKLN
jgi:hypothetical protein